jgi:hypothetical protein
MKFIQALKTSRTLHAIWDTNMGIPCQLYGDHVLKKYSHSENNSWQVLGLTASQDLGAVRLLTLIKVHINCLLPYYTQKN